MIKKEGTIPIKMMQLETLLRRIIQNHPRRPSILKEYSKRQTGYIGEQSLNYHLSFLNKEYAIFQGLRVPDHEGRYFEIDILILNTQFYLINDVKNNKGTLIFDQKSNQMIAEYDGKLKGYQDPIIQTRRQQKQLQTLLAQHKLPVAPIETLVTVSHPNTIIKIEPPNHPITKKIMRPEALPFKMEEMESKYTKQYATKKDIQKISRLLLKLHKPLYTNILQKFKMNCNEILPGVHCPECQRLGMQRIKGYWNCNSCNHISKDAHLEALIDYVLIMNKYITNKECRHFLQISSPTVVAKLLASLNVPMIGKFKNAKYDLTSLIGLKEDANSHKI